MFGVDRGKITTKMILIDHEAATASFTVGCTVILQNLVGGAQYNGKRAVVNSPKSSAGRQQVRIIDDDKVIAVKPVNLRYEPREVSSLTADEMRRVLICSWKKTESQVEGVDTNSLAAMVSKYFSCPAELATILAIIKRQQQQEAIRFGAVNILMDETDEYLADLMSNLKTSPNLRRLYVGPHSESCTNEEMDYIITRQFYYARHPGEILCISGDRMDPQRILHLYELNKVKDIGNRCRFRNKEDTSEREFAECASCGLVTYCSKGCQKADWKRHKPNCIKVSNNEKTKQRGKFKKRMDRFMRLYGPLVRSALLDHIAILAKKVGAGFDEETYFISVLLRDLPIVSATRPYLSIDKTILDDKVSNQNGETKSLLKKSRKAQPASLLTRNHLFHWSFCYEGHDDMAFNFIMPVPKNELKHLLRCTLDELSASMLCKFNTINTVAMGEDPNLYKAIKKAAESKEKEFKSTANRNGVSGNN